MTAPALPPVDPPQRVAVDQRINPDRRRGPIRIDGEGAGVTLTWKGVAAVGGALGLLAACWGPLRGMIAMQETPAKLDAVIVTQKAQTDTINSVASQLRIVTRDVAGVQRQQAATDQRVGDLETWRAGIEQLKETRTRELVDLQSRVRDLETPLPRSRR